MTMLCSLWIRMLAANSYDRQIGEAARVLANGGVVAYPTDTVYGLGADILNPDAIERVFEMKGRPADAPLPVLLSSVEHLAAVVDSPPDAALELADRFWPGALTLVMRTSRSLPAALLREGRVAVRVPDDPICRRLIERLGRPITGTSANKTGCPAANSADGVRAQLGDVVDYILDAGLSGGGLPSTVVEVDEAGLRILREGAIPSEDVLTAWSGLRTPQGG
jgi:L-threonylcarbamoyladenylate synthase